MLNANHVRHAKRRARLFLVVTFSLSFTGALVYRLSTPNLHNFVIFGGISALINLCVYYAYSFRYRRDFPEGDYNPVVIILGGLTLLIPYSIFFVIFAVVLRGFKFPFDL
jgi:F0F1-type ATP synthase assembly protein I